MPVSNVLYPAELNSHGTYLTVGGDNWDKFISTLDAKKFKTEQNWADITCESNNDKDKLEMLETFALAFVKNEK